MILLLPPFDELRGEDLLQSRPAEELLASDIGDAIVSFLDCLEDVILIVRGRHFESFESAAFSLSLFESGVLQLLYLSDLFSSHIQAIKDFPKWKEDTSIQKSLNAKIRCRGNKIYTKEK